MTYELVEFSEVNCDVFLEEGGLLDVAPHDYEKPYGFAYYEIDEDGSKHYNVWQSDSSDNQLTELVNYQVDKDIDELLTGLGFEVFKYSDKGSSSFDSNHKSDV